MDETSPREPFDCFDPGCIMAVIMAGTADVLYVALGIGFVLPAIGPFLIVSAIAIHYAVVFAFAFLIFPKLSLFFPKLVLSVACILPLPLLAIGLFLAIIAETSKIAEFVLEKGAVKGGEIAASFFLGPEAGAAIEAAAQSAKGAKGAGAAPAAAEGGMMKKAGERAYEYGKERADRKREEEEGRREGRGEEREKKDKEEEELNEALGERPDVLTQTGRELLPSDIRPGPYADTVESDDNVVNLKKAA